MLKRKKSLNDEIDPKRNKTNLVYYIKFNDDNKKYILNLTNRNEQIQNRLGKSFRKITDKYDIVLNLRDLHRFEENGFIPSEICSISLRFKINENDWSKIFQWNGSYFGSSTRQGSPVIVMEKTKFETILHKDYLKEDIMKNLKHITSYSKFKITDDHVEEFSEEFFINTKEEFENKVQQTNDIKILDIIPYKNSFTIAKIENVGYIKFINSRVVKCDEYNNLKFNIFINESCIIEEIISSDEFKSYFA